VTGVPPTEPAAPTRRHPTGQLLLGLLLLVGGVLWFLESLNVLSVPWDALFPAALIVVGVALMIPTPGRGGLITLGVILTVITVATSSLDFPLRGGAGERSVRPTSTVDLREGYDLAFGELTVDLTDLDLPPGTTSIEASVGFGELVVRVPPGVAVQARGSASAGEVRLVDVTHSGVAVDAEFVDDGYAAADARVSLDLSVGFGEIRVDR
jgi:cell wall-active antibiotic response 4TMS protein YvqF